MIWKKWLKKLKLLLLQNVQIQSKNCWETKKNSLDQVVEEQMFLEKEKFSY